VKLHEDGLAGFVDKAMAVDAEALHHPVAARDGTVRDLKLVKGYFVLGKAAFDAVKQWKFKPYAPNGKAIDFQTMLTVNFKYPN
jgi:TonB family protein